MWAEKEDPVSNYKWKYGRKEWWEGREKQKDRGGKKNKDNNEMKFICYG